MDTFTLISIISILVIACFLASLLSPILSIGGGIFIVPSLLFVYEKIGLDVEIAYASAVASSFAVILLNSIISSYWHIKKGNVNFVFFKRSLPFVLFGVMIGTLLLIFLKALYLKLFFACFLLVIALTSYFKPKKRNPQRTQKKSLVRKFLYLYLVGIGNISTLFGMSGGTMLVPLQAKLGFTMKKAIATSNVFGVFIAFSSIAIILVKTSLLETFQTISLSPYNYAFVGGIFWPLLPLVFCINLLFNKKIVDFMTRIDNDILRKVFALVLFLMSLSLFVKYLGS